jgi:hypothetical protein
MSLHRVLVPLCGLIWLAAPAHAQTSPACKPVTDAMLKVATTPHHAATTSSISGAVEAIVVDDASYIKMKGAWRRSPVTPKQQLEQEQENIKAAKVYTCQLLRTESVNGVSANAYKVHSENPDVGVSDGTVWVAPSLGLPVRTEEDIDSMGSKMHVSITWDYANIHAPVVK